MSVYWTQGNWNAWVVYDCGIDESRERCRKVPEAYKEGATDHAKTYWAIQGVKPRLGVNARKRVNARRRMSGLDVIHLYMTAEDYEWGEHHLEEVRKAGNTAPDVIIGDLVRGFAAERCVDRYLTEINVDHVWYNDPAWRGADFKMQGSTIDLKTISSKAVPRADYDAFVTGAQRDNSGGKQDFYMWGKHDRNSHPDYGDYYLIGLMTQERFGELSAFYREGEITRGGMKARVDCRCVRYDETTPLSEWLK